ncbi:MAG TPA: hypothetical protein VHG92_03995 [Afifellaceae bacterium]|nr:hypothetical protein [Afifellaceae bacterium]
MAERFAILWGRAARAGEIDLASLTGDIDADQVLAVEPGRTPPFRLNSDTGRRFPPERLTELAGTDAKLAALKEDAARGLDLFARPPRRFLELYFAFVSARIEAERGKLEERLAWSGGLFGYRDWAFSALRPLPRAVVAEIADDRARPLQAVADFIFWTGEEALLVAIRATGSSQAGALVPPGLPVRAVSLAPADLETAESLFTRERFGDAFVDFWKGEDWPAGPYRPRGLEGLGKEPGTSG